ncbi:MAG: T9SS type A sorting domain-containing protein [Bacteroidetes bacterium]|nr:T9SS type A sorting domain-containing protein [Bacteroidota bacterium]
MKHIFKRFLIILTCLPSIVFGNHLTGGEITWKCNGNGAFIFQVKLYRDCNNVQGPNSITLNSNSQVASFQCSLISQNDISPQGPGCPSCASPMGYKNAVEELIYTSAPIFLNGTPPAGGWYFSYTDCCRNASIVNLGAGSGWFTLRAIMYPFSGQNMNPCFDNSPDFAEPPLLGLCTETTVSYSHTAFDPDLDSLSYSWGIPLDGSSFPGIYYPFNAGYTYQSPLPGLAQHPLNIPATLDTAHGIISFLSYTQGVFVTVTKVSSYKCGQLVSEIFREVQLSLLSNCLITNSPNVFNTAPNINPPAPVETFTVLAGDTFIYALVASDLELLPPLSGSAPQSITIKAMGMELGLNDTSQTTGCLIPPCAVLSTPTPFTIPITLSEILSWPTSCSHAGFFNGCLQNQRNFHFVFRLEDNFCPAQGVTYKSLNVFVTGPELYAFGNSLAVSYPGVTVQWYLNGIPIPGATDTIYTPIQSGIYTIVATTSTGCSMLSNALNSVLSGQANVLSNESAFIIFPNPNMSGEVLNVLLRNIPIGSNLIRIYDLTGRLVKQFPIHINNENEHLMLQLDDLHKGIYNISINGKAGMLEENFILN